MSKGNEPAFPIEIPLGSRDGKDVSRGLTKREYFAGLAMQGFAADPGFDARTPEMANSAVAWADALIAELTRNNP